MKEKNKEVLIWISIIFFIIISFYFDNSLVKFVSQLRNDVLNKFFLLVIYISSEVIIFASLTILFIWKKNKRKWIVPLWLTFGISAIVSFILKTTIQRARPFQLGIVSLLPSLQEASHNIWNFSFPSSHAMFVFCAIPILSQQYPKLKKIWIGIAVLIAFSRVYSGLHFVSDVIAGAFLGYVIGILVAKLEKEEKFGEKVYDKIIGR
jgi:undecaprenyl-diphosphatase